jgi:putative ABC transport system substrate-binding protein
MKRIAVVHPISSPDMMNEKSGQPFYRGFFTELHRLGYVEGKNLVVERRSGEGKTERYAEIARELVNLKPDVMVVTSARILAYFREATTTIPIIANTGDPILFGIVSNVFRPEGNVTGFSADASAEIHGKYLELLKEISPGLSKVGLVSPRLSWEPYGRPLREISNRLGVTILGPPLDHPFGEQEFRNVIAAMAQDGADGLLITAAAENLPQRRVIMDLAEKYRIPAIYPYADYVRQGGLAAYAVDLSENGARSAGYVHRILQGAKVADLPYYMPTRVQLFINLRTAKALGLEVPPTLLARADEVIE